MNNGSMNYDSIFTPAGMECPYRLRGGPLAEAEKIHFADRDFGM
jgi:hypothetical protein